MARVNWEVKVRTRERLLDAAAEEFAGHGLRAEPRAMRVQTLPRHHDVEGRYAHIGRGLREIDRITVAANTGSDPDDAVRSASRAGGLALAVMQRARSAGLPLPRAAVLLSPWVDLATTSGGSIDANASFDYLSGAMLADAASDFLAGADPKTPEVSACHADLGGLPPMLVHSGTSEILLDQNVAFVARAKDAGVLVDHEIAEGMIHVFQLFGPIEAAGAAIRSIGRYIRNAVS